MIKHIFFAVITFLIFSGCKKDHGILTVADQPETDVLNASFSDTSRIFAHTVKYDSIPSFNDRYKFLGSNQDPFFGRTDVGLYLNASIPGGLTNVSFGDDANLVSAEIILMVSGLDYVGTGTTSLSYSLFPIISDLDKSKVYYTNDNSLHSPASLLGSYTGTYAVIDGKLALRLPVDYNYAKAILTNTVYLQDNSIFQSTYKGFYITSQGSALNPVSNQGTIAKFDLDDELSGFYLYYQHGTPSATKDSISYRFTFSGGDAVRFNTVKYQPASGGHLLLTKQILENDTAVSSKQNLFLKGLGGTRLRVYIPGLENYADSFPIAVNRAEVVFNMDPSFVSSGGQYFAPPKLSLLPVESDGRETYALDQLNETDLSRYSGYYNYSSNQYVFNIARHVQAILRGTKKNNGFYLVVADPSPLLTSRRDNFAERIILAGSDNATLKPKFSLSYVIFNHDK